MKKLSLNVMGLVFSAFLVASCTAETAAPQADKAQRSNVISPLTQDEVNRLNSMEQEWAASIDKAVPFIRQKNSSSAGAYIKKAADIISGMKDLLIKKGYNAGAVDRLVAMERLTGAYMNMARIAGYANDPRAAARDLQKVRALFNDTRQKLLEAREKFHELPPLQELCRQFLGILDEFEREIKKLVS